MNGPLILAANHPNSFLDAILMASIFNYPVYSLARGDAFVSGFVNKLLYSLNILPVYRITEGVENLENNYDTFEKVQRLLKSNKIILIFSEGRCINEWHLRPLKKGTARISLQAWDSGIDLRVLPVGINYSSFRHFGKEIHINFGKVISKEDINGCQSGKGLITFNQILKDNLNGLVYEIPGGDQQKRKKIFEENSSALKKILLAIPVTMGYLLNAPFYYSVHLMIRKKSMDHYDSIMVGAMFLFYPFYVLLITLIAWIWSSSVYALLLLIIFPITAFSVLHQRDVVEK